MTSSIRELQLRRLGVIQWSLRRSEVLRGTVPICFSSHIQLIIVANELPLLHEDLVSDVLRALKLTSYHVLEVAPDKLTMLPHNTYCNSWRIGFENELPLKGRQLFSPKLKELQISPSAKSELWQQICKYAHAFFPQN